jgi:hypothetical protein
MATDIQDTHQPTDNSFITNPIPTPTHGSSGVFTIKSSINISAPPSTVLAAIISPETWPTWNTFIPHAMIDSRPDASSVESPQLSKPNQLSVGSVMVMATNVNGEPSPSIPKLRKTTVEVTRLEELTDGRKGYLVAWKMQSMANFALHTERVHEILETPDGRTDYVNWETFGGPIAWMVKWTVGEKLRLRFADWGRDLKKYCEEDRNRK